MKRFHDPLRRFRRTQMPELCHQIDRVAGCIAAEAFIASFLEGKGRRLIVVERTSRLTVLNMDTKPSGDFLNIDFLPDLLIVHLARPSPSFPVIAEQSYRFLLDILNPSNLPYLIAVFVEAPDRHEPCNGMCDLTLHAATVAIAEYPELFAQIQEPQTHIHTVLAFFGLFIVQK